MNDFKEYEEFQNYYINILMGLSMVQEEVPPELFKPLADSFLHDLKLGKILFDITNNAKQKIRENKYRAKLLRKGWRKRIRDEVLILTNKNKPNIEVDSVKDQGKSETQVERINSVAVYVSPLDKGNENTNLTALTEEEPSSAGLTALSDKDGPEQRLPK